MGLGFNRNGKMFPSIVVVASRLSGMNSTVTEYNVTEKSTGGVVPSTDPIIEDTAVEYRDDGSVTFTFTIPIIKDLGINIESGNQTKVIYAMGSQPEIGI